MKTKLILSLSIFIGVISFNGYSQCSVTYPGTGACTGCTNNPSGSITLSTNNQAICYTGTSTISTLTVSGNNVTVYICGNITITNYAGNGTSDVVVVNPCKTLTFTNQPGNFYGAPEFVNWSITIETSYLHSGIYVVELISPQIHQA